MKRILLPILLALSLTGCLSIPDKVQLPAGQALLVAEAGVDGANNAAVIAANSGLLKGEPARKTHAAVDAANNAVSAAHTLYTKGDIPGTVSQLNIAFRNVADIQSAAKTGVAP